MAARGSFGRAARPLAGMVSAAIASTAIASTAIVSAVMASVTGVTSIVVPVVGLAVWPAPVAARDTRAAQRIRRIVVLDADADVVAVIADGPRLMDLAEIWAGRVAAGPPPIVPGDAYRLDIVTADGVERWHYRSDGATWREAGGRVDHRRVPLADEFGALLGIVTR